MQALTSQYKSPEIITQGQNSGGGRTKHRSLKGLKLLGFNSTYMYQTLSVPIEFACFTVDIYSLNLIF